MRAISVTATGQLKLPTSVRLALGISDGGKITFTTKNGTAVMQAVQPAIPAAIASGIGLLKASGKPRSLKDFDAANYAKSTK